MTDLFYLLLIISFIIISTTKFNLHPFLTLILSALIMGLLSGTEASTLIKQITEGFGNTLKSIGIVIACGTIIGTFLERSGGAKRLASTIISLTGEKKSPLAMSITGFIVSIPVFCDSGFVILSTLNKAISKKTGISMAVLAVSLGTGLLATHVFVPPTPGPLAAAAALDADIGLIILLGLLVSIPVVGAGLFWAIYYCKKFKISFNDQLGEIEENEYQPNAFMSFFPLILPVILIALKSISDYPTLPFGQNSFTNFLDFVGHPVPALFIGVFLAFFLKKGDKKESYFDWVSDGMKSAGVIILITGAGGAFGNVLRATNIGEIIGQSMSDWNLGILLPFLIAAMLKTAQGSSTVAIITTAAIISPMLAPLNLVTPVAKALVVLSIGAGSMTVSHVNDSYFWVVAQFSNMDTATALKCHTIATLIQGITGILFIMMLSFFLI